VRTADSPAEGAVLARAPKARLFISYSRADLAFADRLDAALKSRGFESLIDRRDIAKFEDWWKRVEELIVRCDTIVLVISPDAAKTTSVCQHDLLSEACTRRLRGLTKFHRDGSIGT
jgi:hypothetical protein